MRARDSVPMMPAAKMEIVDLTQVWAGWAQDVAATRAPLATHHREVSDGNQSTDMADLTTRSPRPKRSRFTIIIIDDDDGATDTSTIIRNDADTDDDVDAMHVDSGVPSKPVTPGPVTVDSFLLDYKHPVYNENLMGDIMRVSRAVKLKFGVLLDHSTPSSDCPGWSAPPSVHFLFVMERAATTLPESVWCSSVRRSYTARKQTFELGTCGVAHTAEYDIVSRYPQLEPHEWRKHVYVVTATSALHVAEDRIPHLTEEERFAIQCAPMSIHGLPASMGILVRAGMRCMRVDDSRVNLIAARHGPAAFTFKTAMAQSVHMIRHAADRNDRHNLQFGLGAAMRAIHGIGK